MTKTWDYYSLGFEGYGVLTWRFEQSAERNEFVSIQIAVEYGVVEETR